MDTITHALLGAAVGRAVAGPEVGRRALLYGAVVASLPDLDLLLSLGLDRWASLAHHRGVTHSVPVIALYAPLVARALQRWAGAGATFRTWLALAFACLTTHALLDLCTTFGTQLLAPFSDRRFAIDAVAIVDPAYSLVLLAAVFLCARGSVPPAAARRVALVALAVSTAYLGLGYGVGRSVERAAALQLSRDGVAVDRVRAVPTLLNLAVWHVIAREPSGALRLGDLSVVCPGPIAFTRLAVADDPLIRAALESPNGRLFTWFADGLYSAKVERGHDGAVVTLADHRYGMPSDPAWTPFRAVARFDPSGRLGSLDRVRDARGGALNELGLLWRQIWHGTGRGTPWPSLVSGVQP